MVLGQSILEELARAPVGWLLLLHILLTACVGFFLTRNVLRLWRASPAEASAWTALTQLAVGALFLLLAYGPLFESVRSSTRVLGVALLVIGMALALLGARDFLRVRSRQASQHAA